jgi:hypothetical protein
LILGTSSDRIGTTEGRSVYATLSKSLERETDLPIAPYAGLAFGGQDDEWLVVGGLVVRWSERWTTTHIYDGRNLHHILGTTLAGGHQVGLMLVQQDEDYFLGVTYGVSFRMPWEGE